VRTKGDTAKPLLKPWSQRERARLVEILRTKSMQEHTSKANSDAAEAMAAVLAFVGGDAKALDGYPAIQRWLTEEHDANGSAEAQA
jgi:hypothetical protein